MQVWYFILADCNEEGKSYKLTVDIKGYNDGAHLSQEQYWIFEINLAVLVVFLIFSGFSVTKYF